MKIGRLRLTFASRILAGYLLIFGIASWVFNSALIKEIKPVVRQSAESALIDTANILAELVAEDVAEQNFTRLTRIATQVKQRQLSAVVWEHLRTDVILNFYITNDQGIVLFSSENKDIGADYSQWRDVYLTLKGQYGARSTAVDAYVPESTVMYIAAPIFYQQQLIGVLTVYNPNNTMQPFVETSRKKVLFQWLLVLVASAAVSVILTYWLSHSVARLSNYAEQVQQGKPAEVPRLLGSGLNHLAQALEQMRIKLEGKAYVENYVQTLTHELKSPMSAIRGAAEMLQEELPAEIKARFLDNINDQNSRMQRTIDQLLRLVSLENQKDIGVSHTLSASELVEAVVSTANAKAQLKKIDIVINVRQDFSASGNRELLQLALANIVDNALEFAPAGSTVEITVQAKQIQVLDCGPGIPEYALSKVGTRFYSLPRPDGRPKSTGLGLALTREICRMHAVRLVIENHPEELGAQISIQFG